MSEARKFEFSWQFSSKKIGAGVAVVQADFFKKSGAETLKVSGPMSFEDIGTARGRIAR